METATVLLPALAQDRARHYQPARFVLSLTDENGTVATNMVVPCAELLRAGAPSLSVVKALRLRPCTRGDAFKLPLTVSR